MARRWVDVLRLWMRRGDRWDRRWARRDIVSRCEVALGVGYGAPLSSLLGRGRDGGRIQLPASVHCWEMGRGRECHPWASSGSGQGTRERERRQARVVGTIIDGSSFSPARFLCRQSHSFFLTSRSHVRAEGSLSHTLSCRSASGAGGWYAPFRPQEQQAKGGLEKEERGTYYVGDGGPVII
ncbi:hypothetical protein GQ53DRAFT_152880 [Thozetella sp. PMI_491]|nr:hypothetical protein GQ53DRAFT_152880 [Thozetella sp. PMI_491]